MIHKSSHTEVQSKGSPNFNLNMYADLTQPIHNMNYLVNISNEFVILVVENVFHIQLLNEEIEPLVLFGPMRMEYSG